MDDLTTNNNNRLWVTRSRTVKKRLALKDKIENRPTFYKRITIGDWRFYITRNIRLKNRSKSESTRSVFNTKSFRKHCYERSGHRCEICGKEVTWENCELHHILPFSRFAQYGMDERNMKCLCHDCHVNIHCDPYVNIRIMESTAKELGVNLNDYYNKEDKK